MALTTVIRPLSGSTAGAPVQVSATTTDTVLHTGPSTSTVIDQMFMYAVNSATARVTIRIQVAGSANIITEEVPAVSYMYPIVSDLRIWGVSAGDTATVIQIGASTSAVVKIFGHVNRITES